MSFSLKTEVQEFQATYKMELKNAVTPFMEHRKDLALRIAEAYGEYDTIIEVCDETKNLSKLQYYLMQFADTEFPSLLFKWYYDRGTR